MCPDPTKGKFILNSQLNFTSTPLSLMPPTTDASTTMTGCNLLLPCAYCVLMFSDDLWCDVPCCHDPLMSPPSRDYRCQDPGPISPSLLSTRLLARYLLMQGRRCGEDWLLNVITRALSLMSAISRSASAQNFYFVWTIFCRLPLFMLPWSETTREVLFAQETMKEEHIMIKNFIEKKSSINKSLIV